jgi:hypothetical protein
MLKAITEYRVGIDPDTPVGGGFRSINVALRQLMDLYACVRPVQYFNGVPSPVKHPELVDMVRLIPKDLNARFLTVRPKHLNMSLRLRLRFGLILFLPTRPFFAILTRFSQKKGLCYLI